MVSSDSGDEIVGRKKTESKKRNAAGDAEKAGSSSKKSKANREKNADGDEMIDLGKNRFVTVREFKGKALVDIREYYQKDGKWCPGKKGISLSKEQYIVFKEVFDEVDTKLAGL